MVDRAVAAGRIAAIRDAVTRIRSVLPSDVAAFRADRDRREIVALNLLVAIQDAVDLAAHWVADAGHPVPGTQREIFLALADQGVLDQPLALRLASACGLRNAIAHQYGVVDWDLVHAAGSSNLGDLDELCALLARRIGP